MSKNFHIKGSISDLANTLKIVVNNNKLVKNALSVSPSSPDGFNVNRVAKALHPAKQELIITEIEDHAGIAKSYYFKTKDTPLAYFRAGQYLTFKLKINGSVLTRSYSIASSPKSALKGIYQITVKAINDGFASDYIFENWKVGSEVEAFAPEGQFVYEPLRDAKTVVAAAGGSGITPFLSMARAIDEKTENFRLILLYGAKNKKEILFRDELEDIAKRNPSFEVHYVLSDEKDDSCDSGFIGEKIIKKYAPKDESYSIFACGPKAMYDFLDKEVKKLGIRKKFYRKDVLQASGNPKNLPGFPKNKADKKFKITLIDTGEKREIPCSSSESVLVAIERAGIFIPSRCRGGECGFCRSKLVDGDVFIPSDVDKRRKADLKFGYIHPCIAYPLSDLTVKIN